MDTSQNGMNFLQALEGCKLEAYQCPAKKWTIGYGNTYYADAKPVKKGDKITQKQAEDLFKLLIRKYEDIVDTKIKVDLTQNQFDALVSHTYNTGGSDTLFKLINGKSSEQSIRTWFLTRYITAGSDEPVKGLVNRRHAECDLFFKK